MKKKFKHILPGKSNNDPIEHRFLAGHHSALDVSTFAQNERTLLLRLISGLCTNADKSQNIKLQKSFFTEALVTIDENENIEVEYYKNEWTSIKNTVCKREIMLNIVNHKITPCIAGYGVKKLLSKKEINCKAYINKITYGYGFELTPSEKKSIAHDVTCIDFRDKGGLRWPSRLVVLTCGIVTNVFEQFLNNEELMNDYYASCSSGRVCLLALKELALKTSSTTCVFNAFNVSCPLCGK